MKYPTIYSHFNPTPVVMEKNSGESEVDIALYKPTTKRIEEYIRSGENLEDLRRLQYHTDQLENIKDIDNFSDPLLYRGYDVLDIELIHKEAIEDIMTSRNSGFSTDHPSGTDKIGSGEDEAVVKPEVDAGTDVSMDDKDSSKES